MKGVPHNDVGPSEANSENGRWSLVARPARTVALKEYAR